jgi:hypothetical protein
MIKITHELADYLLKNHYHIFGYICDQGAVVGDNEFTIYSKGNENFLIHNSEMEVDGVFVRVKKEAKE